MDNDVQHTSLPDPEPDRPLLSGWGRRTFLRTASIGGLVAGVGVLGSASAFAAEPGTGPNRPFGKFELLLLGTQGGPPPEPDRAGISSVLVVDGRSYVIDCGRASVTQYKKSGLSFDSLEAIFLTHLHMDHLADYYNFLVLGGLPSSQKNDMIRSQIPVYGPGPAGGLPPAYGGGEVGTVNPENPTPGTRALTEYLDQAFAYSTNVFMRDNAFRDIRELRRITEIMPPASAGASALGDTAPRMRPFTVMEDDRIRVTATLVPHGPIFPAYAFRFDTDYGSITFSGDTRRSENLIELARGSDILVHEAIGDPRKFGMSDEALEHMLQSHVLVDECGPIAHQADVPHLVFSHLVEWGKPVNIGEWTRLGRKGYSGKVTVGRDRDRCAIRR